MQERYINSSKNDINHAHRIGKPYVDNISKRQMKSIVARFTSLSKCTLVFRGKKHIKDVRLKVDLTKKTLTVLVKPN